VPSTQKRGKKWKEWIEGAIHEVLDGWELRLSRRLTIRREYGGSLPPPSFSPPFKPSHLLLLVNICH
jgi:hypothetical protein